MTQHLFVTFVEETANFSEGCRAPKSSQEETLRGWLCACVDRSMCALGVRLCVRQGGIEAYTLTGLKSISKIF